MGVKVARRTDMNTNLRQHAAGRSLGRAVATLGAAAIALTLGAGVALPPRAAHADATTFSTTKRQYKVGVLLLDSTIDANLDGAVSPAEAAKGPENTDPHLFYIADSLSEVKPQNWDLVNPLAPPTVTAEIFSRWSAPGARDPGNPYQLGQKVTKNMAAYWEVPLSAVNESDLLKFDLLFITHHRRFRLSPSEREKLRKAVDAGAVIWVEDCGNMRTDATAPFFLEDLQFNGGFGGGGGGGPVVYAPNHPILNTPYRLSFTEIANLGDKNYGNFYLVSDSPLAGVQNLTPNPEVLTTVVGNRAATDANTGRALPYIAAGNYGSGAVVVTAGDSGCDINDYAGGVNVGAGGNSGAYCGPNLRTAHSEDLKFLYNLVAWGSSNNTYRRNYRRTGASFDGVNAPLIAGFDFTNSLGTARVNSRSAPLISKGIMYVSGLNAANQITVRAYDLQPFRDYDADGNPDDGFGDLNAGFPFDEIWEWNGPATAGTLQPSGPTLATLLDGTGNQVEVLLVTLPDGTLVALNPLPFVPGTRSLNGTNTPVAVNAATGGGTYAAAVSGIAPSPTLFENKIYVVQPNGVVRCVNGANVAGDPLWVSTAMAAPPALNPTGSPSLGAVRLTVRGTVADNSNGTTNDIILYAPVEDASGANVAGKVLPFWLGTRNEVHKNLQGNVVRTRIASSERDKYFIAPGGPGSGFIAPRVRIFETVGAVTREENYANGNAAYPRTGSPYAVVWRPATANGSFYGGEIEITRGGAPLNTAVNPVIVSVDYDLVYAPTGSAAGAPPPQLASAVVVRGGLTNPSTLIQGYAGGLDTVAVAANDLLVFGANQADITGGSGAQFATLFGLNEQEFVTGGSRMRWRFPLHSGTGFNSVDVGGVGVVEAPALRNRLQFTGATGDQAVFYVPAAANDPDYEPLINAQIVGAPVVTNEGVTYAMARANSPLLNGGAVVTVVMAFRTNPDITLTLPEAFEPNSAEVSQLNMLTYTPGSTTGNAIRINVSANTQAGGQFVADASRGRITIIGFQPPNGGPAFSASQSFVVRYTPVGGTSPKTVVLPPSPTIPATTDTLMQEIVNPNDTTPRQGAGGFSPLLWHYVLPGNPLTGPTLIGDQIYFTRQRAGAPVPEVVAVDSRPQENDPTVRVGSGEQVYGVVRQITLPSGQVSDVANNHVAWSRPIPGGVVPEAPLVGSEGTLAVNSNGGTFAFQEALTLVADSKRLLEVAADGSAVWVVDSTVREETVGGAGPVYRADGSVDNPNDTGRFLQERKPFSKPQMARKLSTSDYLVADTGNNRVVRIDRAGKIQWGLERAQDPHGVLAAGDPTTLNGPTDVQFYQVRKFAAATDPVPSVIEDHYVIADAGNYRILEVVDYRDTQTGQFLPITDTRNGGTVPGQGIVVWTTRTGSKQGRQLRYQSVRVFPSTDDRAGADGAFGRPTLVAVVSNTTTAGPNSTVGTDFTGGSLVELDYNPYDTPFYMTLGNGNPAGAPNPRVFWPAGGPEPTGNGLIKLSIGEIVIRQGGNTRVKRVTRPTYFERVFRNIGGVSTPVYLICDAEGVYACTVETPTPGRTVFVAQFKMEQEDYNAMNLQRMSFTDAAGDPLPLVGIGADTLPRFVPTSVKLMSNGNYLITNSHTGANRWFRNGKFTGEAFEVEPQPLVAGVTVTWLRFGDFSVPRLDRVVLRPSAATPGGIGSVGIQTNEQRMGNRNNTDLTEQPLSSDRL